MIITNIDITYNRIMCATFLFLRADKVKQKKVTRACVNQTSAIKGSSTPFLK